MSAQSVDTAQLPRTRPVGRGRVVGAMRGARGRHVLATARHVPATARHAIGSERRTELRHRRLYASAGLGVLAAFFATTVVVLGVVR